MINFLRPAGMCGDPFHMVYHKGGGDDEQETTTTPYQSDQYDRLLGRSDQWLNSGGFDKYYGGSKNFDPVANMNTTQKGAINGMVSQGRNLSSIYNGQGVQSLQRYLGEYDPNKTGLAAAQGAAAEQAQFDFETGQMGNIRQGASQAGQYGSTRAGIAEGLARGRLAQGIAANNAQMAYQDQQAYNQNQMTALNNLSQITQGLNSGNALQYDAGSLVQNQQQNEIAGRLQKWAYENNVDLNNLLAYKNLISGDMGGTSVSEGGGGGGGNGFMGLLGQVGGMAAGSYFGGTGPFG
jgi:hypothetical protein